MIHLRAHLNSQIQTHNYQRWQRSKKERDRAPEFPYQGDTPLNDLEVIVVELRFVAGARMSLSLRPDPEDESRTAIAFTESGRDGAPVG